MFGSNNWGQLGLGSKVTVNKPTCVKGQPLNSSQFLKVVPEKGGLVLKCCHSQLMSASCEIQQQQRFRLYASPLEVRGELLQRKLRPQSPS